MPEIEDHFEGVARWWLERGFLLLPCQPGTKYLVRGFGPHGKRITKLYEASVWWWGRPLVSHNMAVLCPAERFVLDFDDLKVYQAWAEARPEAAASYSERSPRGGMHVFLAGRVPRGVRLIEGVELRTFVLVAPSQLGHGLNYRLGEGEILGVEAEQILSHLAKPGYPTPYLLNTRQIANRSHQSGIVDLIKFHFPVVKVLSDFIPGFQVFGSGRFVTARCPFHKNGHEEHPSFWIDSQGTACGCHACGFRGDSINVYARLQGITDYEAISRMRRFVANDD